MKDYHSRHVRPDTLIAGVSGDFETGEFVSVWKKHFGDWHTAGEAPAGPPPPDAGPEKGVFAVAKDLPQATVVAAWFAPPKESTDYPAFMVLNYILGGAGFNSRLTEEVRSNRGLAYSVGSFYTAEKGYGVFGAYCRTGIGNTTEAAELLAAVVERAAAGGVTAEELEWARQSILNSLIFAIDSSAEMVRACREKGLTADQGDIFELLVAVQEGSVDAVLSFHVIEHLDPGSLGELASLAHRALTPGGVLILETPSPLSLVAGARNFWRDPTHRRPVHPDSLLLALERAGFADTERVDVSPFAPDRHLPEIDLEDLDPDTRLLADRVNRLRDRLDDLLFGYQDFAVIGRKR